MAVTCEQLSYSAHPSRRAELRRVCEKVAAAFDVTALAAVHRVGDLAIGDLAVVVAVSCPHRAEAFTACRALIDELKQTRADLEAPGVRRRRERMGQQCVSLPGPCPAAP